MNKEESLDLYEQEVEAWNIWANDMLAKKAALEDKNEWQINMLGLGNNQATKDWLDDSSVDFTEHIFKENVDFSYFIFPYSVWFRNTEFSGNVWFKEAEFIGNATFYNASFNGVAGFKETKFNGDAGFKEAKFNSQAWFKNAKFGGEARFKNATFSGDALFDYAKFSNYAEFEEAKFNGPALFIETKFRAAGFQGSEFSGDALFKEAKFSCDAKFHNATFGDVVCGALFYNVKFGGDAGFNNTTFGGEALFKEAEFGGDAEFDNAKFRGDAVFNNAEFGGDAGFNRALFEGFANFNKTIFKKSSFIAIKVQSFFSFKDAEFHVVPDFTQAHFIEAPQFDGSDFSKALKHSQSNDKDNLSSNWRSLKRLAIQGHDHERELIFFAEEIKSQRGIQDKLLPKPLNYWNNKPVWPGGARYWFGGFYQFSSVFGRSVMLPLFWLLILGVLFCIFYLNYSIEDKPSPTHDNPITQCERSEAAIYLSARSALPFIPATSYSEKINRSYECLYGKNSDGKASIPNWVIFFSIIQTILSTILTFLSLLALRNHFKIN